MHGQLFEWCDDLWHPSPLGGPQDGSPWVFPRNPSTKGGPKTDHRLMRGGSYFSSPNVCRAAFRFNWERSTASPSIGVRPCCLLPQVTLLSS